jgi:hypothetical protein
VAFPFRNRASFPRSEIVTGERLLGIAELAIVPRHIHEFHRNLSRYAREMVVFDDYAELDDQRVARISAARSIFVYTHALPDFIERVWPRLDGTGYVLITHNSDHEVNESHLPWLEGTADKLRVWFAQNVTVEHPKLVPLPIGIANSMWDHGNLRLLHRWMRRSHGRPKSELLYAHFNPVTHPDRERAHRALRTAFPELADAPDEQKPFGRYLDELARHRFCACPRGNGIDTHRFWECQYLGVVPVVERSLHTEHWRRSGLPLVTVDDWSEVSPGMLGEAASRLKRAAEMNEHLRLSYYERLVRASETTEPGAEGLTRHTPGLR